MQSALSTVADVWVPILGALGGLFATLAAVLWWAIRSGHKIVTAQDGAARALVELNKNVAALTNRITRLSETSQRLELQLTQREKDHAKLEGKLELIGTSLVDTVGSLRELRGSIEAAWIVLGHVAPDYVRSRNGGK